MYHEVRGRFSQISLSGVIGKSRTRMFLREWLPAVRIALHIISQPQLQRIHLECVRQFVHRRCNRVSARGHAERARAL